MKTHLFKVRLFTLLIVGSLFQPIFGFSQTAEWRLVLKSLSSTDPDGAGLAMGSVQFDLEMHAVSGTIAAKEISAGYSYQSTKAMVPSGDGLCPSTGTPMNITVSPQFVAGGYTYTTVNQCNILATPAGGQLFDRTASGSLDQGGGAGITLTTAWVPALTITLWTLSPLDPEGGYAMLRSGSSGNPGPLGSYSMADADGNEVTVNSLSYNAPLALSSSVLPVGLSKFDITCTGNGAKLNWQTLTEQNSRNFEVQKSNNGASGWTSIGTLNAAGNSNIAKHYEYYDLKGGSAYYRLRQVDKDGQFTYSAVQNVSCKSRSNNILLYPVPAKNTLNVVLSTERETKATILLVDISGKVMRQVRTDLQKGMNNLKVNVAGLSSGEYILKVVGSEVFNTQKVTIIN